MSRALDLLPGLAALAGAIAFVVWLFIRSFNKSDDPMGLAGKWVITLVILPGLVMSLTAGVYAPIFGAALAIILAIIWAPSWATMLFKPLTNAFDGGTETDEKPLYSIAEAKRKLGKYPEAIAAIREELIRFPNDFHGQMMIAEIQAMNLKDLAAARETIELFVVQEGHPPANIAFALNRLSEWQAAAGEDEEARRSLEEISLRFPETEYAYHASQRLAHLNSSRPEAKNESRRIVVPHNESSLVSRQREENVAPSPPPEDWDGKVKVLITQLETFPADNEAREQLALIYAREYGQLGVALDQFEQMIAQPGVPMKRVIHWLNVIADLQITEGENVEAARLALQRIVDLSPEAPEAEKARQRMRYLALDMKGQRSGTSVKMEANEKKPGIPKSLPRLDPRFLPDFSKNKSEP